MAMGPTSSQPRPLSILNVISDPILYQFNLPPDLIKIG